VREAVRNRWIETAGVVRARIDDVAKDEFRAGFEQQRRESERTKNLEHLRRDLARAEGLEGSTIPEISAQRQLIIKLREDIAELKYPCEPPRGGVRQEQLRLLQEKAEELGLDLKALKKGEGAKLKRALMNDARRREDRVSFSNWRDIWKAAVKVGIAQPVK
jgi:hypothetical protein